MLNLGILELIPRQVRHMGLDITTKMYFAQISFLKGIGCFGMAMSGLEQEMFLS